MDDSQIIDLFFQRSEDAIDEADRRYGTVCRAIARNLLGSEEDAEECVNDTFHALWNAMPPRRPDRLGPFMARITRNLAMKRLSAQNTQKRRAVTVSYDELDACIPAGQTVEQILEGKELSRLLDAFLRELDEESRNIFLRRYWFFDSVRQIAQGYGISETKVTTKLYRIRNQLKAYLEKEAQIYVG